MIRESDDGKSSVIAGGLFGFLLGWMLVGIWQEPVKALKLLLALVLLYMVWGYGFGGASSKDVIRDNEVVAATTGEPAKTKAHQHKSSKVKDTMKKGCPDEAPNVGEPFLC